LIVGPGDPSGLHRQRPALRRQQLFAFFIEADHRPLGRVRLGVQIQNVFHALHIFGGQLGHAPHFLYPRLHFVFFTVRYTVFRAMLVTTFRRTSSAANKSLVQRWWPLGGWLQAMATSLASWVASSFRRAPGRGFSVSAVTRSPFTYRSLMRSTVQTPICKASAMVLSVIPWSLISSVWARLIVLVLHVPALTTLSNSARSVALRWTI